MNQTDQEGGKAIPESLLGGQSPLGYSTVRPISEDQICFSLNQGLDQNRQAGWVIGKVTIEEDDDFILGVFDDGSHVAEGSKAG